MLISNVSQDRTIPYWDEIRNLSIRISVNARKIRVFTESFLDGRQRNGYHSSRFEGSTRPQEVNYGYL